MKRLIATSEGPLCVFTTGEGPPLLLIAGLGGRGAFWSVFQKAASRHFSVTIFDHPGCGESPASSQTPSSIGLATTTLSLLDALQIEKTSLIGHSLGGAIAQHMAIMAPARVNDLVISASWAGPNPWFSALFQTRLEILEKLGPAAYLQHGSALGYPAWWAQENFADTSKGMAIRLATFPETELEKQRMAAVVNHDARHSLKSIRAKTLVIAAHDDSITPPSFAIELAEGIPSAQLKLLRKGGHFAPQTVLTRYKRLVLPFLLGKTVQGLTP